MTAFVPCISRAALTYTITRYSNNTASLTMSGNLSGYTYPTSNRPSYIAALPEPSPFTTSTLTGTGAPSTNTAQFGDSTLFMNQNSSAFSNYVNIHGQENYVVSSVYKPVWKLQFIGNPPSTGVNTVSGTASIYLPAGNTWAPIGTTGAVGWGRQNNSVVYNANVGTWKFVAPTYWTGSGGDGNVATAGNWSNGAPVTGQAYSFGALAGGQASAGNTVAGAVVPAIRFLGLADPEYSNAAAYTLTGSSLTLNGPIVSRSTNDQTINTDVAIGGGGGVVDTGAGNITIGGVISGADAVTKWGAGTLRLTNSSTYTSNVTTIAAGTLQLDFAPGTTTSNILPSSTALTIGSATLLVNSASSGTQTQTIGNLTFAANGTQSSAAAGAAAITLVSNGSGNVALTAGNTWTRNKGTSLNVSLGSGSTFTSSPAVSTTSSVVKGSGTTAFAVVSGAATTDWATVSGGNVVAMSGSGSGGYADDVYGAGVNTNVASALAFPTTFTTDTLAFRTAQSTTMTLTGANSLALGGLLVGAQVGSNATVIGADLTGTLSSGSNELVVHHYGSGTLEIAAPIVNNGANATALTKTGPGTLILSGTNTYSGGNYLLGGSVSAAGDTNLGNTASGLIFDGGTLQVTGGYATTSRTVSLLDAGGTFDVASTSFTVSAAISGLGMVSPLTKKGSGTLILTGASSYQGSTTILDGTLQIGSGGAGASIGTGAVIDNGTLAFNHSDVLLFPNMVSGTGNLTHAGTGTVTMIHANTYTGTTTINGGTLQFASRAALYNATPSSWTAANVTVNSGATLYLNVGGTGEFTAGDVATIASLGTASGGFRGGSFLAIDTTNSPGAVSGLSGTVTIPTSLADTNGGGNQLGLKKAGAGTLRLAAANSYTGTTSVAAGTLQLPTEVSLYNANSGSWTASNIVVASGATLALNVGGVGEFTALDVGVIAALGGAADGFASGSTLALDTTNAVGGFTYSNAITNTNAGANNLALNKLGSGTLVLSGANTYKGATTVSNGTLNLDFSAGGAATNIVNNGGTNSALMLGNGLTGGRLVLTGGASAANSQAFNGTTLNAGSSSVQLSTNATPQDLLLTLGAITRAAGGVVDFTLPSGTQTVTNAVTTTTANGSGGIIGGWATVGGTDWAVKSTSNNLIVPIGNSLTTSAYTTTVPTTGGVTTANYSMTAGTLTGSATALSGNLVANSLRIANASNSQSLDLAGKTLTFTGTAGGLLYVGGADNNYSITDSVGTSFIGAGAANEFIVNTSTGTTLGISAPLIGASGTGGLTKAGGGQLTIAGTSTYTGNTTIVAGTLQLGDGGSAGKLSASSRLVNDATLAFNRSDTATSGTDFASVVTGSGNVVQKGSGTVVFSGTNTYTGSTTVTNGTLNVTGSIVKNGSADVSIAPDPDGSFSTPGPTLSRAVAAGGSYGGFGSSMAGGLFGKVDIRAGSNVTGADTGVTMQWRARAANESASTATQPPLPGTDPLLSDVLNLTGMVNSGAASGQTDAFALQVSYDPVSLARSEVDAAAAGLIHLDWLNPTGFGGSQPLWQNAVAGNFGTGTSVVTNVLSSWDAFAATNSITDSNVGLFLGSWGVDSASHVVWAVVNHNSQFAVAADPVSVPEPATSLLGLFGLCGLFAHGRRRRKTPRTGAA